MKPLGHPHPGRWTFSTDSQASSKRFDTAEEAAIAATDWLRLCAENRLYPAVQIKELEQ